MGNKNTVTGEENRVIQLFGSELAERIKKLMQLNGDETIGDFILNSAFAFLDELELKFKSYINKGKESLAFLRPLNGSQANPLTESATEQMAKMIEGANRIMKICEHKTLDDFIHDATHVFLDRIERWFDSSLSPIKEPERDFHFDSEFEEIADGDSKTKACKKFQVIMHKEFASYIQRLPW